jgi:hypothetical protein
MRIAGLKFDSLRAQTTANTFEDGTSRKIRKRRLRTERDPLAVQDKQAILNQHKSIREATKHLVPRLDHFQVQHDVTNQVARLLHPPTDIDVNDPLVKAVSRPIEALWKAIYPLPHRPKWYTTTRHTTAMIYAMANGGEHYAGRQFITNSFHDQLDLLRMVPIDQQPVASVDIKTRTKWNEASQKLTSMAIDCIQNGTLHIPPSLLLPAPQLAIAAAAAGTHYTQHKRLLLHLK